MTQPKRLAVLAYLALGHPTGFVRRDALVALLWPELDAHRARNALSQAVHGLRRDLGPGVVLARGNEEIGLAPTRFWCDAVAFRHALDRHDDRTAVMLYRGDFLESFHVTDGAGFERWLDVQRGRLKGEALRAALRLAEREERAGRAEKATRWLRHAVDIAPTDEVALRRLMSVLVALGNEAGALLVYEQAAARLRGEYELELSAETRDLAALVRARRAAARRPTRTGPSPSAADESGAIRSIAVLPLKDLGPEPADEYLATGLVESLTTELGRLRALRVLSHRSALHYQRSTQSAREIGAELGVDAVVEGTVRRWDGQVRVTAELVRVAPHARLWQASYERPLADLPHVMCEVAHAIAGRLASAAPPATARPILPAAYAAVLRGRYLSGMMAQTRDAMASFERAIALDPAYAPAYAGLAMCFAHLAVFAHLPPGDGASKLAAAAGRAVELDAGLSEPHVALGIGKLVFERDWSGAEREFRRAVDLNPSSAYARAYLAIYLSTMGWTDEGVAEATSAVELDSLDPWTNFTHGFTLYRARQYDASLEGLRALIELYPHHALAHLFVAENELKRGHAAEGRAAVRRAVAVLPDDPLLVGIAACVLGLAGDRREARRLLRGLEELARTQYVNPSFIAAAYAGLGEHDAAFSWWDRMLQEGAANAFLLRTDPLFDRVRSDPRFADLLRRLALPEVP